MYLNCHTGFSFKYGTLPIETLFKEAQRCGVKKLILTEINNTASYLEMLRIRDKSLPRENGLTKFGEQPYQLDIAVGIGFREGNELRYLFDRIPEHEHFKSLLLCVCLTLRSFFANSFWCSQVYA